MVNALPPPLPPGEGRGDGGCSAAPSHPHAGLTRRAWLALPVALPAALAGCGTLRPVPPVTPLPSDEAFAWPSVLREAVDGEGRVDFRRLRTERGALDIAAASIARRAPNTRPAEFPARADQVAFHLNAFNALAMYAVVRTAPPPVLGAQDRLDFMRLTVVVVGGQELSLAQYRDRVIRPLGEERVHFALNDMTRSSPRLRRIPYTAEGLDTQLDAAAREFLDGPRVQVDRAAGVVRLPAVLERAAPDLLKRAPTLLAYVSRYRQAPVPEGYKAEFVPYDWTLNDAAPA